GVDTDCFFMLSRIANSVVGTVDHDVVREVAARSPAAREGAGVGDAIVVAGAASRQAVGRTGTLWCQGQPVGSIGRKRVRAAQRGLIPLPGGGHCRGCTS